MWVIGGIAAYYLLGGKSIYGSISSSTMASINKEDVKFNNPLAFPGTRKDVESPCSRPVANDSSLSTVKAKIAEKGSSVDGIGNAIA